MKRTAVLGTASPFRTRIGLANKWKGFSTRSQLLNAVKQAGESVKPPPPPKASKSSTIKELTKKYGWTAVGVYFALSALDLPVAYLIVHSLGKDKTQQIEKAVKDFFGMSTKPEDLATVETETDEKGKTVIVEEETPEDSTNWSIFLTEFTLAYAIHKSVFLLFRIPACAAITPWAARTLQRWGFNVGKKSATPRFGTPPSQRQKWFGGLF